MQSRAPRLDELRNDEVMTNEKTSRNRELFFSSFGHFPFLRHSTFVISASSRISQHFFDGGVASEDAAQTVLAQCYHSKLNSLLFQCNRWRPFIDQFTTRIGDSQQFVDSFSSLVSCVVTSVTTFPVEELFIADVLLRDPQLSQQRLARFVSSAALAADAAQQTLTEDGFERG